MTTSGRLCRADAERTVPGNPPTYRRPKAALLTPMPITLLATVIVIIQVVWSGFFVMSLELLGGRLLTTSFGSGIFVWGAVISVFMFSLASGYLIGGYLSARRQRFRDLGYLLLGQGISALLPLQFADVIPDYIFESVGDLRYGALLSAIALFFIPTTISGVVSPYSVRLMVHDVRQSGRNAGLLYFGSTIGSAAGTIVTSFYLVLWFEIDTILWLLVGASCILGLMSWLLKDR
jgi:hypothetical protein